MLVSENQMIEGHGILLFNARHGLSYQIAGALARLGRRVLSVNTPIASPLHNSAAETPSLTSPPTKETRFIPLQDLEEDFGSTMQWVKIKDKFTSLVWTSPSSLSNNKSLNNDEWIFLENLLESLKDNHPDAQPIIILPICSTVSQIAKLHAINPSATILLSPQAWGFEDHNLLDLSFSALKHKGGILLKELSSQEYNTTGEWISFDDIASLIVVTADRREYRGRIIRLEGQLFSIEQWRKTFVDCFKIQVDFFEKWAARLSSENFSPALTTNPAQNLTDASSSNSSGSIVIESARHAYPMNSTPLVRNLNIVARAHNNHPELKQVFTPSRAL